MFLYAAAIKLERGTITEWPVNECLYQLTFTDTTHLLHHSMHAVHDCPLYFSLVQQRHQFYDFILNFPRTVTTKRCFIDHDNIFSSWSLWLFCVSVDAWFKPLIKLQWSHPTQPSHLVDHDYHCQFFFYLIASNFFKYNLMLLKGISEYHLSTKCIETAYISFSLIIFHIVAQNLLETTWMPF